MHAGPGRNLGRIRNSFWVGVTRESVSRFWAPFYLSSLPYWIETRQSAVGSVALFSGQRPAPHTPTLPLSGREWVTIAMEKKKCSIRDRLHGY